MPQNRFQTISECIAIALLLCSCGGTPIKPSVVVGVVDYPAGQVIENTTNGQAVKRIDSFEKATARNVRSAILFDGTRVPLSSYDKAICFKPDSWNVEVNYLHSLERFIRDKCSQAAQ